MADGQNKRMLFTDFDTSDKGRPPPASNGTGVVETRAALTSLADLASTLELDFEDDIDEASPFVAVDENVDDGKDANDSGDESPAPSVPPRGDDRELSLDETGLGVKGRKTDTTPLSTTTWEEFTRAFHEGVDRGSSVSGREQAEPAAGTSESIPLDDSEDGGDIDILSMLDHLAKDAALSQPVTPWTDSGHPNGDPASPTNQTTTRTKERDGSQRVFHPPAGTTLPRPGPSSEDGLSTAKRRRGRRTGGETETRTGSARKKHVDSPNNDTSVLFSGVDLDRLWQEKINRIADARQGGSDTRLLELFNDVDLEALWNDKAAAGPRPDDDSDIPDEWWAEFPDAVVADTPVDDLETQDLVQTKDAGQTEQPATIAPPPNEQETVIVPETLFQFGEQSAPVAGTDEDAASSIEAAETASDDVLEIDDIMAAQDILQDAFPEKDTLPMGMSALETGDSVPGVAASSLVDISSATLDFLDDIDDVWEDSPAADVAVPNVGNDDLQDVKAMLGKKLKRKGRQKAASKAEAVGGGGAALSETSASGDTLAADDGVQESLSEDQDYIPDVRARELGSSAGDAPTISLTTDDLLDGFDFDQFDVNNEVSAPVIDNSAINDVRKRQRRETESSGNLSADGGPEMAAENSEKSKSKSKIRAKSKSRMSARAESETEAGASDAPGVDPVDIFANLEEMDFSDDLDDELRELMDGDSSEAQQPAETDTEDADEEIAAPVGVAGTLSQGREFALGILGKMVPGRALEYAQQMIAWRENWWFYCDVAAVVIASASLGVIISHWFWYR